MGYQKIAEVVNYVRSHFGNQYKDKVTIKASAIWQKGDPPMRTECPLPNLHLSLPTISAHLKFHRFPAAIFQGPTTSIPKRSLSSMTR